MLGARNIFTPSLIALAFAFLSAPISFLLLLFLVADTAHAGTYLPIDSRLYDDFRFLEAQGVITSSQLSTLPISRLEGLRLTREALSSENARSPRVEATISRLEREFHRELDGDFAYLTPLDTAAV